MMAHSCDVFHLFIYLALLKTGHATVGIVRPKATAPGDIIIGGLFSVHQAVNKSDGLSEPLCIGFDIAAFTLPLAMINAIETVNKMPILTNLGITLGYRIYDTCSDVSTALRVTADMTQQSDCTSWTNASSSQHSVMAVIGDAYSEISIAVARLLSLHLIPQISYASSAYILSDKTRFPAFMRTVPSDLYQTRAMVRLLSDNNWNWVGVITTDGDYGRSALGNFVSQASHENICVAFQEVVPDSVTSPNFASSLKKAAETINHYRNLHVVISFLKPPHTKKLFEEISTFNSSSKKVWVASNIWSSSSNVLENVDLKDIGQVVGFNFRRGNLTSFYNSLSKLGDSQASTENSLLNDFYKHLNTSIPPLPTSKAREILSNKADAALIFSLELAVSAIAYAVEHVCETKNCTTPGSVQPSEVLKALSKFEYEGKNYTFDSNGDMNLGFDITMWRSNGTTIIVNEVVAQYNPLYDNFRDTSQNLTQHLKDLKRIYSRCSETCQPGQSKKTTEGQHTCCYECINCTENYYSNNTDVGQCLSCNRTREWSPAGSSKCIAKTLEFFSWQDGFAIVLLTFAALGILLVFLVGALFLWKRNTPVVKAAGGPLSQLILFSLVCSFVSALLFVGHSSELQCKSRQVLIGLSFTLCVSCILVKSLKILLAFRSYTGTHLRRYYKPYPIVCGCVSLQVLTCTPWLILYSPTNTVIQFETYSLAECAEGSYVFFGVMLGYIAVLALVCFICAFKGRKLPQNYNEAKFITFSMLLYLISWVIFVPVYVTTTGKYLPAVEMVVILISCYGVLCCQFFPKCYIILFRKEHNTERAFKQNVHEYCRKSSGLDSLSEHRASVDSYSSQTCIISSPSIFWTPPIKPTSPQNLSEWTQNMGSVILGSTDRLMISGQPHRYRARNSI